MKTFIALAILTLTLLSAGCATSTHPTIHSIADIKATITGAPVDLMAAEIRPLDPLVRVLTSPTFVDQANRGLAAAATDDLIFRQCVQFGLDLGQALKAAPLIQVPNIALATVDLSCPLCLLAAKRRDLEAIQSGALATQIAEVRARKLNIRKRFALACGPLSVDKGDVLDQAVALFGGLH